MILGPFLETTYDKFIFRASTDCLYTEDEMWVRIDGDAAVVGVTDFQQKSTGDVAYLELPHVGRQATKGQSAGVIETIKATSDIISPLSGRITVINQDLEASPFLINQDPYGAGWIYRMQAGSLAEEINSLMSPEAYFEVMKNKVAEMASKLYG